VSLYDILALAAGIAFAGIGGELFVRGAVGLAHWARISPGIIGATVAAFATSSPELSVAVNSALAGQPAIALGDALGSNVVNVALILGIAVAISGMPCPRDSVRRDFPVALAVPLVTAFLARDGAISRGEGGVMLALFSAWLVATALAARRQRSAADEVLGARSHGVVLLSCAFGLGFLLAAGHFIVLGARGIAVALGLDEFVIGATVVALGTSTPELATTIIARWRGHAEVGLGTILGSNIFNGAFIVPVAAVLYPVAVPERGIFLALAVGVAALVLAYPWVRQMITRWQGGLLLSLYGGYLYLVVGS
jgi:cation:H+ antiporter